MSRQPGQPPGPAVSSYAPQIKEHLLQAIFLAQQALKSRPVDQVVGEFLAGKHVERRFTRRGDQLAGFFDLHAIVLGNHVHDHRHHELQPANFDPFRLEFRL